MLTRLVTVLLLFDIQTVTATLLRWFWMRRQGWIKQVVVWPSPVW